MTTLVMRSIAPFLILLSSLPLLANGPRPPAPSPARPAPGWFALTNATLIPAPGRRIENATIVIRDGVITSVAQAAPPPPGATVHDCTGLIIAPAFIDAFVEVETPTLSNQSQDRHWSDTVQPERSVLLGPGLSEQQRKRLRDNAFAVAHIVPTGSVFSGRTATVLVAEQTDTSNPRPTVLPAPPFHTLSFATSGWGQNLYPGSKMGAIALIRQTFSDAQWYRTASPAQRATSAASEFVRKDASLEALSDQSPLLFAVNNSLDILRAAKIATEAQRTAIYVGSGDEYQRILALRDIRPRIIVPLRYPHAPDLTTPAARNAVNLRDLMAWEQAPANIRRLKDAGITTAITSSRIPDKQNFYDNLRLAIACGLPEDDALAMLTTTPATILSLEQRIGRVEPGYLANLQIIKGDSLFADNRELRSLWIAGVEHVIKPSNQFDFVGQWSATLPVNNGVDITLTIDDANKLTITHQLPDTDPAPDAPQLPDTDAQPSTLPTSAVSLNENRIAFIIDLSTLDIPGKIFASAILEGDDLYATLEYPDATSRTWTARRTDPSDPDSPSDQEDSEPSKAERARLARAKDIPDTGALPFGPYATSIYPQQQHIILTNATIWTGADDGILTNAEIEIRDSIIRYVGESRRAHPDTATVIDCRGKHITPGLIDCHSHTGISGGVNEPTFSSTAMVRIADVIDPDDINWYRQLAGGLTTANQLHGSANAIGGQNSVVKLRWGVQHPDNMRFVGAPEGIKFALGENVKQSNWGDDHTTRYPQTRMGVETFIVDRLLAAQDYAADIADPDTNRRRDLELEALAEILDNTRLIHCHSYRQDEILMLCRVAERFGFTIGTFQHVLEGYKVAEHIRDRAFGGSAFSDWWAYKFEVFDAIPENGAIMHEAGVNVSFNSDSDEMARRMNVEAAKAVKYGGIDPHEALKFVTLNPAIQLGIDHRVGSLEVGKDADLAVWSSNPLSTMSRCEMTIVDGRILFSIEEDTRLRELAQAERSRIIQKILSIDDAPTTQTKDPEGTPPSSPILPEPGLRAGIATELQHLRIGGCSHGCDTCSQNQTVAELESQYFWMLNNGIDPRRNRPGQCGCGVGSAFIYSK